MMDPAATPPELAPGDRLTLTVHDVGFGGEGVARWHDFVLFIPFVLPAEVIEAEVTEVKKRFARAKLVRFVETSPHRVEPRCPYYGDCGGCQYQHMAYPLQLEFKRKQVTDLLERIGHFSGPPVAACLPCPRQYEYRNRIMIRSQWNKPEQKLDIGYIRHDNRLVVDIEECKIAEPELNAQIQHVRRNPPPKGGIKVLLRIDPPDWEVPNHSFFQNNFHMLDGLLETVREALASGPARQLIDLYCGVGFFTLELASRVDRFAGVEIDAKAVASARVNATRRNLANGEFLLGAAEELLPRLITQFSAKETALLLDPPRRGCDPGMLELIRQVQPAQVIYISCHPATLARDLRILCSESRFRLEQVVPVDMFPQTRHVECVAHLRAC